MLSESQILDHYSNWDLQDIERHYLAYHVRRFAYVLQTVGTCLDKIAARKDDAVRVLDIGPHFLTELMVQSFPQIKMNTLGFRNPRCYREERIHAHLQYDLNDAQFRDRWPGFELHDVVVMSEVIEHLYTAPELVLDFIKQLIRPGGFLVIQTPNAVSLDKRIAMLRGANPFEMIRTSRGNPGHFREYTLHELRTLTEKVGMLVDSADRQNYFNSESGLVRWLGNLRPGFRQGITIVCLRSVGEQRQAA